MFKVTLVPITMFTGYINSCMVVGNHSFVVLSVGCAPLLFAKIKSDLFVCLFVCLFVHLFFFSYISKVQYYLLVHVACWFACFFFLEKDPNNSSYILDISLFLYFACV